MNALISTHCHCADLAVGRIDKSDLSQQTLMEILVSGITNREYICDSGKDEDYKDISKWNYTVFADLGGNVTAIYWDSLSVGRIKLAGTLNLNALPPTVKNFDAFDNVLQGSLDLTNLPGSLRSLFLTNNAFTGTICVTRLPGQLEALSVSDNQLSGTVDLTKLPKGLTQLSLNRNLFEGETDFRQLPESLVRLHVGETSLSGEIFITCEKKFDVKKSKVKLHFIQKNG
mmetsp:Transcript_20865/g.32546  ORF Transcript_20865/g.32546 Transcript_20865/m.32546 type:complete len:229 (-) Transcript_20865:60-746(-)